MKKPAEPEVVDLEPSEWSVEGRKEPFWGPGAGEWLAYIVGFAIAAALFHFL